jgi:hypothetical protein
MGGCTPLWDAVIVSRTFTILAATLLVTAFGLLVLAPYDMPLVQGLGALDSTLVERIHRAVLHSLGHAAWGNVVTPVLARPIWLIPLSLGIVCVGVATTTNVPATTHRTRRRS